METEQSWLYRARGRNAATTTFTLLATAFFGFGFAYGAPWPWMLVTGLTATALWAVVVFDTRFETRIDGRGVTLSSSRAETIHVPWRNLERLQIVEGGDSTEVYLVLADRSRIAVSTWQRPGATAFAAPFQRRGVAVERR